MSGLLCQVYRSRRLDEMYLYVERARGLVDVPESLMARFGEPESTLMLLLTPDRCLARVEASRVIEAIRAQGYYLQMPPGGDALDRDRAFDVSGDRQT